MAGLKFRVLLDSVSDKEIFRDIVINDSTNLEVFYHTIIDSFGLSKDQMASFFVSNEEWDKGEEISLLDLSFESSFDDTESPQEMNSVLIKDRIDSLNQRFILVHDFLAMWIFLIEMTEVVNKEVESPEITLSIGKIPEDLKETGPNRDNLNFETDYDPNQDPFGFGDDDGYDDDDLGGYYDDYDDFNF